MFEGFLQLANSGVGHKVLLYDDYNNHKMISARSNNG